MSNQNNSILEDVKIINGILPEHTDFDSTLIPIINSSLGELYQMGVVSEDHVPIVDSTTKWTDIFEGSLTVTLAKEYIGLRVQSIFNPPSSSQANEAMNKTIERLEYRLRINSEGGL